MILGCPVKECCGLRADVEGLCRELFQQSRQNVVVIWITNEQILFLVFRGNGNSIS